MSVELTPPEKEDWMDLKNPEDFEIYCKGREYYVKIMTRGFLKKYQRAIENSKWEIFLVIEEPVLEPQIILN